MIESEKIAPVSSWRCPLFVDNFLFNLRDFNLSFKGQVMNGFDESGIHFTGKILKKFMGNYQKVGLLINGIIV
jgi:hypothetical protein